MCMRSVPGLTFSGVLPRAGIDGVVLPTLAAADVEHDGTEDEHDAAPGEVEVDAERARVERGVAVGDDAEDGHQASDDEEDEAEGDADVETHKGSFQEQLLASCFQLKARS